MLQSSGVVDPDDHRSRGEPRGESDGERFARRSLGAPAPEILLPGVPAESGDGGVSATVFDLPEHVAESDVWKVWPRKAEAHLRWGVRQRQIEAFTRSGKLKVYSCPDGTKRIDPDVLCEMFGEPDVVQGRARDISASERRTRQVEATAAASVDPMALMFGKTVGMMQDLHVQLIGFSKVVTEPMQALLASYKDANAALALRVRELEVRSDEAERLRSELSDAKQERDIQLQQHAARERRRDETLALLKEQAPILFKTWLEGNTLSEFGKRTPRGAVEAIIESGEISEQDADILRRAAGIPKPAANTAESNGVSNHGNS